MSCARVRQVLDALVDRELDAATQREIETHLASCPECERLRAERTQLRERVRREAPYFKAPESLRRAVSSSSSPKTIFRPSWLQMGAIAAAAGMLGVVAGVWIGRPPLDDARRNLAVASHVASLSPQRKLIEVASSDRHTVKPWFSGKIDFSPPVRELAADGFKLEGARLDHVGDRQAAAVVYRVRNHDINLFVWRAVPEDQREEVAFAQVRGYGVATWAENGLRFAAVSDVDTKDLERFTELVRQP